MRFAHRDLDPRPKLALAVVLAFLAVAIPRLDALAGIALVTAAVVAAGEGFGLRPWIGALAPFKVLVPLIFVLNAAFYGGGEVLWRAPAVPVAVTVGGVETSAVIAARLLVIAAVAAWFSATTEPEEFEVALSSLGVPWGFAFLLSLTLRLVPEMRGRFRTIEEAQRSRGLVMEGGPISRARARIPMLIPFLVSVVEYGYDLSEALSVRDFGHTRERTYLVQLEHGRPDYALYAFSIAVLAAFVAAFGL